MDCPVRHTCWQSKRLYWKGTPGWRAGGRGNPGELLCYVARSLGFDADGVSLRVVFGQSLWLGVLPGGVPIAQPRWMPVKRVLGDGRTYGISFWPFLNSSCWLWLTSSVFPTRTSCRKIIHAHGYCGARVGWAVSVSVLPLILPHYLYGR